MMGPEKGKQRTAPNPVEHRPDGTTVLTLDHKGQPLECIIDTADFPLVSMHTWSPAKNAKTFYAVRTLRIDGKPARIYMHSLIFGSKNPDHKDRNGLNNRRSNLRPATRSQQQQNQGAKQGKKFRGITWVPELNKWRAFVRVAGKLTALGCHDTPEAAARAYDDAARKHYGEFAALNFPQEATREQS